MTAKAVVMTRIPDARGRELETVELDEFPGGNMCYDLWPVAIPAPDKPGQWRAGNVCPCAIVFGDVYYVTKSAAFEAAEKRLAEYFRQLAAATPPPPKPRWHPSRWLG